MDIVMSPNDPAKHWPLHVVWHSKRGLKKETPGMKMHGYPEVREALAPKALPAEENGRRTPL